MNSRQWTITILALGIASVTHPLTAQQAHTVNTLTASAGSVPPGAHIRELSWMEGHWRAEALGGTAEEWWNAPAGGSMAGMFRAVRGDTVLFYEIFTISPLGESLEVRLKHFNRDMTGWEEKNEVVRFPLVSVAANVAHFDGLTYRRIGSDTLVSYVAVRNAQGVLEELEFRFTRIR